MFNKIKYFSPLILLIAYAFIFVPAKAYQDPVGTNVAAPDGTIYTITYQGDSQIVRRPYSSAGAYLSYGFNSWDNVTPASVDDLSFPIGSLIPPQDGKVICSDRGSDQGTCYIISEAKKLGFTSASVFYGQGFSFDRVMYGDVSFLPTGVTIGDPNLAHTTGTLINNNGTVELVVSSYTNDIGPEQYYGIPDINTFQSWGYSFANVVPANQLDMRATMAGILETRKAGKLNLIYPNATNLSLPPAPTTVNNNRDAQRLANVRQLASAFELYFNDYSKYPPTLGALVPKYIGSLPSVPTPPDGNCTDSQNSFNYILQNNSNYSLSFCLGSNTGGYAAGPYLLSPSGINPLPSSIPPAPLNSGTLSIQLDNTRPANGTANPGQHGVVAINLALGNSSNHSIGIHSLTFYSDSFSPYSSVYQMYLYDQNGNQMARAYPEKGGDGTYFHFYILNGALVINAQSTAYPSIQADITATASGSFRFTSQGVGFDTNNYQSPSDTTGGLGWWTYPITIVPTASIFLLSPKGGEQWNMGTTQTIQWSASSSVTNVNLELVPYAPANCNASGACSQQIFPRYPIAKNIPNSGSYSWIVGQTISGIKQTGQYTVNVIDANNPTTIGSSQSSFNIISGY